ncbi:CoA-transferase family III domain-containing protein [Bombardia bombarda]|uniref:CoA-transferase family III domain-containing protein n=1 Tax=Bombardia bombarda TaxID=252184 RepID=A0AA40C2H6_9PEZI|nr:CoA-transferase family III domain-containing protein [Bombardia bombarda]
MFYVSVVAGAYSVPSEAKALFENGILKNPLIEKDLPAGALEAARHISFEGSDSPSLPINWRFAESISSLKAYEATVLSALLQRKYGVGPVDIKINTDHAQLFIMSSLIWVLDPGGANLSPAIWHKPESRAAIEKHFPNWDKNDGLGGGPYKGATTNIYKTKDGKFFHTHNSMNPSIAIKFLELPTDVDHPTLEDAMPAVMAAVAARTADELQTLSDTHKEAGTICWTTDEYKASEHGRANAHVGLFEIEKHTSDTDKEQPPTWWPSTPLTSPARPLAGLKVVDLTRVIAGPAISRGLAELGASVMRIVAPHLPDLSALHPDLSHGKWNACLDLRKRVDREKLRALVLEADVFVQGYRPGVLDKYGFGEKDVIALGRERGRGIIYCAENSYGWHGPWQGRSGWQQISDANCGVSYEFGRAMGNDEPVTPVFPNSDYCTGIAGVIGIMTALLRRAEEGGSYSVKLSLNYYSQWLVNSCGVYPPDVWAELVRTSNLQFRHYHPMQYTLPKTIQAIHKTSAAKLFKPSFFAQYKVKVLGDVMMRIVAPVLQFPGGEVKPGYHIGVRTNGVDQPRWPDDLGVEVVE